jgi:hypothetical protein
MKVELILTPEESNILINFLSRTPLKGSEALVYVQLEQKIRQAQARAASGYSQAAIKKTEDEAND